MINLRLFSTDRYGLPILSENDLDNIGELLVRDFAPEALKVPQEIDIEAFSELYMGLQQDFQYLTHRGIYLGMTIFKETYHLPVYNPQLNQADYIYHETPRSQAIRAQTDWLVSCKGGAQCPQSGRLCV